MKLFTKISLALTLFGIALTAQASFTQPNWQFIRPLSITNQSDFAKLVLPQGISTNPDWSDIRVISETGAEIPYLITRSTKEYGGETSVSILNRTSLTDGRTSFILDAGQSGIIKTALSISTTNPNFRRQVSVYGSDTLLSSESNQWALITDKGYLFKFTDNTANFSAGKDTIELSKNTFRYIKVVIGSGDEGTLNVTRASLYNNTSIQSANYSKEAVASTTNNIKKRTSEIVVDQGREGFLTHAITLGSSDKNYNRKVIIETSQDGQSWSYLSQGYISSVSTALFEGNSTRLTYSETNARFIRASVINEDNRPLTFENKVTLEGPVISVLFETRGNERYSLYYGNRSAQKPQYDIVRLSQYIEESNLPIATIGNESINPNYVAPEGPVIPFTERNTNLLNVFLGIIVVILCIGIGFYFKHFAKNHSAGGGFEK